MNQTGPPEQMDWDGITQIRWRNEKTGLREKDDIEDFIKNNKLLLL